MSLSDHHAYLALDTCFHPRELLVLIFLQNTGDPPGPEWNSQVNLLGQYYSQDFKGKKTLNDNSLVEELISPSIPDIYIVLFLNALVTENFLDY